MDIIVTVILVQVMLLLLISSVLDYLYRIKKIKIRVKQENEDKEVLLKKELLNNGTIDELRALGFTEQEINDSVKRMKEFS